MLMTHMYTYMHAHMYTHICIQILTNAPIVIYDNCKCSECCIREYGVRYAENAVYRLGMLDICLPEHCIMF